MFVVAALGIRPSLLKPAPVGEAEAHAPNLKLVAPTELGTDVAPLVAESPLTKIPETNLSTLGVTLGLANSQPAANAGDNVAIPHAAAPVAAEPVFAPAAPIELTSAEDMRHFLAIKLNGARSVRFLWQTDAANKITSMTPPLSEVTGHPMDELVGQDFSELARRLKLDPSGRLIAALQRKDTWSGVEVLWPVAGAAAAVPVGLGALPAFDAAKSFEGYRGFGVVHVDRLIEAEPVAAPVAAPIAAPVVAPVAVEAPKVEALKIETPIMVEAPKFDAPKFDAPKLDVAPVITPRIALVPDAPKPVALAEPVTARQSASELWQSTSGQIVPPAISANPGDDEPLFLSDLVAEETREAERKALADKLAAEKAAAEKLAAAKAEAERLAAEKSELERLAAAKAENERLAAIKAEEERIAEAKAVAEQLEASRREEQRLAALAAEEDRLAALHAEEARIAAEKAEEERLIAEQVALATAAKEKAEAEAKAAAEKIAAEKLAAEKAAEEAKHAAEKLEAERFASEKANAEKLAALAASAAAAANKLDSETISDAGAKVVPLRPVNNVKPDNNTRPGSQMVELSATERNAFREIARALGAHPQDDDSSSKTAEKTELPVVEAPAVPVAEKPAAPVLETPIAPVAEKPVATVGPRDLLTIASTVAAATIASKAVTPKAPESPTLPFAENRVAAKADDKPADELGNNARTLLDRLPAGVLVSRGDVPIFLNKTLLDLLGYADADAFYAAGGMERMFKGRQPESLNPAAEGGAIPIITNNGTVVPVDARIQRIEWDGLPASLLTLRRTGDEELTPRIQSLEHELRQREAETRELHDILDTATDGVAVLDSEGRILSLNRSGEALFGYDQNALAGEPLTVIVAKESHAAAMDYLDGLKANGVASVLNDGREIMGRARQGGTIPLFMTLGRVGRGSDVKFCAVLRDMSNWKKAERELNDARKQAERASALKSDFLAKISHEIRTPLNAILGFAEVIMEERFGPVGNERYKDYMKDIHSSGAHVMSLVNDLLDLSKIEAGKMDLNFISVDANRIVGECVSIMQPQASRERVIMRLALAPRLPNIVADERSLRQIVLNLLSNAVKFNEAGGQVIVSTALTDAGHAVIRIRDTGVGMSDAEVETALEPFRQLNTARTTSGTGLGLPLTKALIEANRASFTIKSKRKEGTLVEIAFPPTRVLAE